METKTHSERRLEVKTQQREEARLNIEEIHRELDGGEPNEAQKSLIQRHRKEMEDLDVEIDDLSKQVEADREAAKKSESIRRAARAAAGVADTDEDGIVYRSMASYARDVLLTHKDRHVRAQVDNAVGSDEVQRAAQRLEALERTPATTLTSDLAGLNPPQHIAQIFQVIDSSRDLVNAAGMKANLNKGTVTYPQVDTTPVVAVQGTQKTEAGNTGMDISMVTATAGPLTSPPVPGVQAFG